MSTKDRLSKRQLAVIDDLFAGKLDEQTVLQKHKVSRNTYNTWLADDRFIQQFNDRIARAHRHSQLIIARYAPLAAAKLVQLTGSDSAETARKACLDIISMSCLAPGPVPGAASATGAEAKHPTELPPETASRLLAALAEEQ